MRSCNLGVMVKLLALSLDISCPHNWEVKSGVDVFSLLLCGVEGGAMGEGVEIHEDHLSEHVDDRLSLNGDCSLLVGVIGLPALPLSLVGSL